MLFAKVHCVRYVSVQGGVYRLGDVWCTCSLHGSRSGVRSGMDTCDNNTSRKDQLQGNSEIHVAATRCY